MDNQYNDIKNNITNTCNRNLIGNYNTLPLLRLRVLYMVWDECQVMKFRNNRPKLI